MHSIVAKKMILNLNIQSHKEVLLKSLVIITLHRKTTLQVDPYTVQFINFRLLEMMHKMQLFFFFCNKRTIKRNLIVHVLLQLAGPEKGFRIFNKKLGCIRLKA